jgi:hypothetical protein
MAKRKRGGLDSDTRKPSQGTPESTSHEQAKPKNADRLETSLKGVTVTGPTITILVENPATEMTCYVRPLLENEDFQFEKIDLKWHGDVATGEATFTRHYEWKDKGPRWIYVEIALEPQRHDTTHDCAGVKTHVAVLHWNDPGKTVKTGARRLAHESGAIDVTDSWSTERKD